MRTFIKHRKAWASWTAASLTLAFSWVVLGAVITGTPGADVLVGSVGNDTINALSGADLIIDPGGDDQISAHGVSAGGAGPLDIVVDFGGNDRIFGGPEVFDIIVDLAGNNKIATGGGLFDLVVTGAGNDEIAATSTAGVTSALDVFVDGGGGGNVLNGGAGLVNFLVGGSGNDTITSAATLLNIAIANINLAGTDRNTLTSQSSSIFGVPGVGILIDAAGPDRLFGGNQAFDFLAGISGAPAGSFNQLNGGDENFTTLPFPGDLIIGGAGVDNYLPGKGFDINLDPLGGNDTIVLRPGDTVAGTGELVFCGPGLDKVFLKGFNNRTTAITTIVPGFVLVSDVASGAGSGYVLILCEQVAFTR